MPTSNIALHTSDVKSKALIRESVSEESARALVERECTRLDHHYIFAFDRFLESFLALRSMAGRTDEELEDIDRLMFGRVKWRTAGLFLICLSTVSVEAWAVWFTSSFNPVTAPAIVQFFNVLCTLCLIPVSLFGLFTALYTLMVLNWANARRRLRKLRGKRWLPYDAIRKCS